MAQPNHHLQTVYPSDYKTQTKLSGWIIHKIMDQSQFDKAKKKEEHNKTSIQEKYVLKKRLLKIFKNKKKKTIPHYTTLHYTTHKAHGATSNKLLINGCTHYGKFILHDP